jgi:HD-GYP domain-containing protein (c-di-GMP phosphodiesterase class II)
LPEHVAQFMFGVLLAVVAIDYLWVLPVFALPIVVVYVSLRRNLEIRTATAAAVESLADIVDLRQPDKAGHSQRVALLTRRLAEHLELPGAEIERIVAAARVHDVGKVDLNPAIALRSGDPALPATGEERTHPVVGARLIAQFPNYVAVARDVLHHHESWDGTGYPDGLAGEAIPLGARLISVAEAYDSFTSPRGARPSLAPEAALRELEHGAGRQWDPRVVRAMVAVVREELVAADPTQARTHESLQAVPG